MLLDSRYSHELFDRASNERTSIRSSVRRLYLVCPKNACCLRWLFVPIGNRDKDAVLGFIAVDSETGAATSLVAHSAAC